MELLNLHVIFHHCWEIQRHFTPTLGSYPALLLPRNLPQNRPSQQLWGLGSLGNIGSLWAILRIPHTSTIQGKSAITSIKKLAVWKMFLPNWLMFRFHSFSFWSCEDRYLVRTFSHHSRRNYGNIEREKIEATVAARGWILVGVFSRWVFVYADVLEWGWTSPSRIAISIRGMILGWLFLEVLWPCANCEDIRMSVTSHAVVGSCWTWNLTSK